MPKMRDAEKMEKAVNNAAIWPERNVKEKRFIDGLSTLDKRHVHE